MDDSQLPDEEVSHGTNEWPHAPPHRLSQAGVYFVTARTVYKAHLFHDPIRLDLVTNHLRTLATHYGWQLEEWAVLINHYHVVAHSPADAPHGDSLRRFITHLHSLTARDLNRLDNTPGRRVWQNYMETHLTYQNSYLARLNYTHQNPVSHRVIGKASEYPWCSAAEFERACTPAWVKTIYSFKADALPDDM